MDSLTNYNIEFVKLKQGLNNFNFEIRDAFFSLKENSLFRQGSINVLLKVDKKERQMNLLFEAQGLVGAECDVCLDSFNLPVNASEAMVIMVSDEPRVGDSEIVYVRPNDLSINVYDYIYEIICTCIPMSKTCKDNTSGPKACNAEMLNFLSNQSEDTTTIENQTDPRWDKLKNIKD